MYIIVNSFTTQIVLQAVPKKGLNCLFGSKIGKKKEKKKEKKTHAN